jgi:hypothetical protein
LRAAYIAVEAKIYFKSDTLEVNAGNNNMTTHNANLLSTIPNQVPENVFFLFPNIFLNENLMAFLRSYLSHL